LLDRGLSHMLTIFHQIAENKDYPYDSRHIKSPSYYPAGCVSGLIHPQNETCLAW
jgi:hypothetical protein